MSKHTCEVVPVVLEKHPKADNLSIVRVWGYQVVVRTDEWKDRDRGVYIPPDSVCPNKGQFTFLYDDNMQSSKNPGRVKVRKFRGEISQGLLVPAPSGARFEHDFMKEWGIEQYVSGPEQRERAGLTLWERILNWLLVKILRHKKLRRKQGQQPEWDQPMKGPTLMAPVYDVENLRRYNRVLGPDDEVYVTEKIHGCNSRFVYYDRKLWAGSRTQWKKQHDANLWWKAVEQNPWIKEWCMTHPDRILYGEVFGQVQDLKYDTKPGQLRFLAFDVFDYGRWLDLWELNVLLPDKYRVPVLYVGKFDLDKIVGLAEQKSTLADHCREGVVVCTVQEEKCSGLGRKQLKVISNRYLERGK